MMLIRPIASGSSGNCYFISDGATSMLLDCGIPVKRIKEGLWSLGRRLSDVSACLVTHCHGDHVKSAQKLADQGINIITSGGTIEAAHLTGRSVMPIKSLVDGGSAISIGSFVIYALEVEHDAPETLAFIVFSTERDPVEKLLYVTDTEYFRYKVDHLTHILIEANYDNDILSENASTGRIEVSRAKRTVNSHMSIETALLTLARQDRSMLQQVWLLHLSSDNAGDDFKRRVQELTGVEVYIA